MAFLAAASGSLSSRAPVRVGGVRKRGEAPDQFDSRMSSSGFTAAASAPMSPRAANIAKARADGTFDAKRNAFNAANSGSHMDSQGNIGPKAPPLPGAMPTTPTPAPAPAAPSPANVAKDSAPLPKPKAPATFDGQSKAGFFGAAMARNGRGSSPIYDDPAVQSAAANSSKSTPKPSFVQAANPTAYRARNGEWMQGKTQAPAAKPTASPAAPSQVAASTTPPPPAAKPKYGSDWKPGKTMDEYKAEYARKWNLKVLKEEAIPDLVASSQGIDPARLEKKKGFSAAASN